MVSELAGQEMPETPGDISQTYKNCHQTLDVYVLAAVYVSAASNIFQIHTNFMRHGSPQ